MTAPAPNMQTLALEFVGGFSLVQDAIDNLASHFFEKRTPGLAKFVWTKAIARIRDDDRPGLLLDLAGELNSDAPLTEFKSVFKRAKAVRDYIGHSARVETVVATQRASSSRFGRARSLGR